MAGYSSDGSSSYFTPEMPNEAERIFFDCNYPLPDWRDWCNAYPYDENVEKENNELSATSVGLTHSQTNQNQLNQVETSEGSFQTKSGGGRAKLTPAQKKENKRQSDYIHRQKKKRIAAEQTAESKHLKEENERLNAENRKLKESILQLLDHQATQRHDTCISQSTNKQPDHQSVSAQLSGLETNDLQDLHQKIPITAVATDEYVTENQQGSGAGICYDNKHIKLLMKEIDEDDESDVCFSDFTGLDGERVKVGKYNFPLSLRPVVERILAVYGDVSATSKMNLIVVEATYILLCASIKEMGDLQLEQVTENRILKWRDTIKDALRINFKVDFAMDHLKKIARAYIGLIERQKLENMAIRISKLEADLKAEKEQSKEYMDAADEFNGKPVSAGLFQSLPTAAELPLV